MAAVKHGTWWNLSHLSIDICEWHPRTCQYLILSMNGNYEFWINLVKGQTSWRRMVNDIYLYFWYMEKCRNLCTVQHVFHLNWQRCGKKSLVWLWLCLQKNIRNDNFVPTSMSFMGKMKMNIVYINFVLQESKSYKINVVKGTIFTLKCEYVLSYGMRQCSSLVSITFIIIGLGCLDRPNNG